MEREPLPDEIPEVEKLIEDHKEFMENTAKRQPDVDRACKPKAPLAGAKEPAGRKPSRQLKTPVYVLLYHLFDRFVPTCYTNFCTCFLFVIVSRLHSTDFVLYTLVYQN